MLKGLIALLMALVGPGDPLVLNDQTYASLRDRVAWTSDQARWNQLPWMASIPQAMIDAQNSRRLVLVWQERGQPLGMVSTHGIRMRNSVWKDPQIQSLVPQFCLVAVSADQRTMLTQATAKLLKQLPSGARPFEGIAVFDTHAKMVFSTSSLDPGVVAKGLSQALAAKEVGFASRGEWLEQPAAPKLPSTVWRVISRDLSEGKFGEPWYAAASNVVYLAPEKEFALPEPETIEQSPSWTTFPRELNSILAERVLVDSVRGIPLPFDPSDVQKSELRIQRTSDQGNKYSYRIVGKFTASAVGEWSLNGDANGDVESQARGIDVEALGRAKFDREKKKWVDFEILFLGTRWGGSPFNVRINDTGAREIGFLLTQIEPAANQSLPILRR